MSLEETDLILVRHARPVLRSGVAAATWVLDPAALPETRSLADALAARLSVLNGDDGSFRVVASHEPKAVATARELAEAWACPYASAPGLEEHHRGPLPLVDDLTWRTTVARLFTHPTALVFGEETAEGAHERFARAVAATLEADRGVGASVTTIVSHGTVITLYLAAANRLDPIDLWGSLQLPEALLVRSRDRRLLGRMGADGELRPPTA